MKRILPATALLLSLHGFVYTQAITTITYSGTSDPVPLPVDSLTPVDGYRTYDSLTSRYLALALEKDFITLHNTGTTIRGRTITSYRFSSDATTTPEGIPKSGAMIQGTIHAREWASPEVTTAVFEWLAGESDTDPVAAFLLENTEIVIHPIGNPDGFIMTQLYPAQTVSGVGGSGAGGRDGRMRRKNMRGVDENLSTFADYLEGIDLNRNHAFGFQNSSSTPGAITYRGATPGSEPESQALYAAAALLDEARLRYYVDIHSYSQLYYLINDISTSRNNAVRFAYNIMSTVTQAVSGRSYSRIDTDLDTEAVGATDEYFTGTYRCMGYTLEIRPTSAPNGFILPDNQIDETRSEVLAAVRAGMYYAAGPAAMIDLLIYDTTNGRNESAPLAYRVTKSYDALSRARTAVVDPSAPLQSNRVYTLVMRFNKPLRLAQEGTGNPVLFPGISGSVTPAVSLTSVGSATNLTIPFANSSPTFGYARYPGDTIVADLDLASLAPADGLYSLSVTTVDLAGVQIDADPATVADWSATGWQNWDAAVGTPGLIGGPDKTVELPIITNDNNPDSWLVY